MTARSLMTAFLAATIVPAAVEAQLPKPALLVANKAEASLVVVNPATGAVVGRVATGDGPHEVVADGTHAFVANYGTQTPGNSLSVIELATLKEVKRVDLGPMRRPHWLALAEGRLVFTAETNRVVGWYHHGSGHVEWALGTGQAGTHMVWAHPSGSPVITTNIGSDTVSVMERGANPLAWTVTQISTGKGPEGFDVSPDGVEMWVAHSRDGGLSIVDVATKKVVQTLDLKTKRSNRLKFTPDGTRVLVSDLDAGDLIVIEAKTRAEVKRLPLGRNPSGILVVPDGTRAYVGMTGDNAVAVVDLKKLELAGKIQTGAGPDGMAWVR